MKNITAILGIFVSNIHVCMTLFNLLDMIAKLRCLGLRLLNRYIFLWPWVLAEIWADISYFLNWCVDICIWKNFEVRQPHFNATSSTVGVLCSSDAVIDGFGRRLSATDSICLMILLLQMHTMQPLNFDPDSSLPGQDGRHFADDIFKCIFLNENVWILVTISLKCVPKGPIDNNPALI